MLLTLQWLSLEPILTAADIQRQLPSEARAFTAVDRQLKEINRKARDRPNALQVGGVGRAAREEQMDGGRTI